MNGNNDCLYERKRQMIGIHKLIQKRQEIERLRQSSTLSLQHASRLEQSIISSWHRSESAFIPSDRTAAPLTNAVPNKQKKIPSAKLKCALQICEDELKHIADQSSMVLAVGDVGSTIIWSAASKQMRSAAEQVHFIEGGQWREDLVGTNALALTLKTQQSSCVFSNEHYMESIQDWVCYAAPVVDQSTHQILGVIDLSTVWKKHNSLGLLAAERCASIIQNALLDLGQHNIYIRGFSSPQVLINGKVIVLTPRQIEILCILALCPTGLNLEQLHQALYGERKISMGTLKAEMSQIKDILGDLIISRPYRFQAIVEADFLHVESALDAGYLEAALKQFNGAFLAKTESPFLCTWRDCIESRLSEAIFNAQNTDILLKHLAHYPEAVDALERLLELVPNDHPAHHKILKYQN